ncbi:hypothetical protein BLS_001727 [Venturia inaequalis]|uniref:CFEM domain-containing protein n=1 Tax=Venturia inaequalis TaxID=5025 RepID=A0A8H3VEP2_VENIN|nr:hypothetical protein BLS_001727 [Venturia inaequalis]KAE9986308.1 hypothetical protein EG328_006040 [Venturia inaequalis]KAE9993997.1 hypothetical protein EG327_002038 [Venturia inaequalis]RDI81537.1 hypothetical protein Vi05172_g8383 [Venturia inaequalis]
MKFILALVALCASSVAAEACAAEAAAVPACGATCIEKGAVGAGCTAKDYKCYCAKTATFGAEAVKCVAAGCGQDILKVKSAAEAVCACAGKA